MLAHPTRVDAAMQVNEELKLEQVIKQVQKLPDVLSVERHAAGHPVFTELAAFM